VAVLIGLVLTITISARRGNTAVWPTVRLNVLVGAVTMVVTYYVGVLFAVMVG
jgi:vacuolar iron transporter family protein